MSMIGSRYWGVPTPVRSGTKLRRELRFQGPDRDAEEQFHPLRQFAFSSNPRPDTEGASAAPSIQTMGIASNFND
jgi:hypothetical protein